ncbi:TIGR02710 family CRISPR-associated CARF protein [Desulfolutivibrio sulfoxidireducens]|uniref:TIGR02710 family CRISPR-associated CARF protein n=1 Tax=Desulfolutivibrio sulfoxidireducens TaxID=2773299 RepID=UPI00159D3060|nr:TIGR02710 family CRISPR-associated CARF protein [Desulfolutivibrio sulfoxidireducens]QLA19342.1 TIGR02710 family CRISPR-associated protein [Desulfolutivibrio sulfoxidireducens]
MDQQDLNNTATSVNECLVLGVGGSPAPIIVSINTLRPRRIVYVASIVSRKTIREDVEPNIAYPLQDHEIITLSNEQSLVDCVRDILRELPGILSMWGIADRAVLCDFTGGTKVMSAALVLALTHFGVRYTYVGGTSRTKNGLGVVENGKEKLLHLENPWDMLAVPELAHAADLFNACQFQALRDIAVETSRRMNVRRPFFEMLATVAEAYNLWDGFQYRQAHDRLRRAECLLRSLGALADCPSLQAFLAGLCDNIVFLERVQRDVQPYLAASGSSRGIPRDAEAGQAFLLDLLANATRRADSGRHDDAVARLYSAMEKIAKTRLAAAHGIDNSNVDAALVPESQREDIASCRDADGRIRIGLERSYRLLGALGDPLGEAYLQRSKELSQLLQRRNQSLLAHGFRPVDATDFQKMMDIALSFLGIESGQLPAFPRMDWKGLVL